MGRARYILRYRGQGRPPAEDLERIRGTGGLEVIDGASGRMLLVEAPDSALAPLLGELSNWVASPEREITLPDPRRKVRRGFG